MPNEIDDKNLAIQLAEQTAAFLQPAEASDAALVRAAVQFSLDITPRQNMILLTLEMLSVDPNVPEKERAKIKIFVSNYLERKQYDDARNYIADLVRSISWRHFAESGFVTGSVNKSQQSKV